MGPDRSGPVLGFHAFFLFFIKKNTPTPAAATTTTMTITIQMGNPPLGDDASSNMTAYLEKWFVVNTIFPSSYVASTFSLLLPLIK